MQKKNLFFKKLFTKHKPSINLSLNDDLSFDILKGSVELTHLSDSTEEGGIKLRQSFNLLRTSGHSLVDS